MVTESVREDGTPDLDSLLLLLPPPKTSAWAQAEGWDSGGGGTLEGCGSARLSSGPGITICQGNGLGWVP